MIESTRVSYATPSRAVRKPANCAISVPAANALPPAPRSTMTLIAGLASTASHASRSPWYISQVSALCASGRLNVRNATGGSAANSTDDIGEWDYLRFIEWAVSIEGDDVRSRLGRGCRAV